MDARLRQLIRQRAKNCCEYCGLLQEQEPLAFHIEHITPRQHGGKDTAENLALACHHCNLHKGTNLSGLDPKKRKIDAFVSSATGRLGGTFHKSRRRNHRLVGDWQNDDNFAADE